ncbi:MAG: sialate O-acetylesterase [Planctomycetota bacterium]
MTKHLSVPFILLFCTSMLQASTGGDPSKPIRVFILAGQSNMEGTGFVEADPKRNEGRGSLEYLVRNSSTAEKFGHLKDANNKWVIRDDVFISYLDRKGPLTVGFGAKQDRIGPELGFGCVVGDKIDDPVVLIKCAWGGKSLAVDFRPPGAGPLPYSLGEKGDAELEADPDIVGHYYRDTLARTRIALQNLHEFIPDARERGYVIAGFGWHQGWNDRIHDRHNAEYESNMVQFIRDIRHDLGVNKLPFVIAETGMTGPDETHPRAISLMKAQAAAASQSEFEGNVALVRTREFWRPKDQSPTGQGYHWNTNAETYYLIGEAMGHAMLKLME